MDLANLPGSLKLAILIQSVDKNISEKILGSLTDSERNVVQGHLSQMGPISPDVVEKVAAEFTQMLKRIKSQNPKQGMLTTPGGQKNGIHEDTSNNGPSNLEAIQSLEPDRLVELIKDEHPQTIALILVHFKPAIAGRVLSKLPEELRPDVAIRMANLEKVNPELVAEVDKVFEEILKGSKTFEAKDIGGVEHLAEIFNQMDGNSGQLLMDEIEEINPELAAEIKQKRFVFEDLVLVDDRGLQKVLRNVESKDLAVALKAASEEVKEKIYRNMSERAADMLKEEIDSLGAVRMKEVEDAQQIVTKLIQDMEAKGEIIISGRGGDEFVA